VWIPKVFTAVFFTEKNDGVVGAMWRAEREVEKKSREHYDVPGVSVATGGGGQQALRVGLSDFGGNPAVFGCSGV